MERIVVHLCGLWFWLTRRRRVAHYRGVARSLRNAHLYLVSDYAGRASTQDRGFLLPDQLEALAILERQHALVAEAARRLDSLTEVHHFVAEELTAELAAELNTGLTAQVNALDPGHVLAGLPRAA